MGPDGSRQGAARCASAAARPGRQRPEGDAQLVQADVGAVARHEAPPWPAEVGSASLCRTTYWSISIVRLSAAPASSSGRSRRGGRGPAAAGRGRRAAERQGDGDVHQRAADSGHHVVRMRNGVGESESTMTAAMSLDDLVPRVAALARPARAPSAGSAALPSPGRRRLLIVQIDGLSRAVLERGAAPRAACRSSGGCSRGGGYRLHPMCVGMPTSTPAFQMAAMYGVPPDIPGFHYHDKRRRRRRLLPARGRRRPRRGRRRRAGRRGIVTGGSTYGCVFTGGADNNLLTFAMLKRPSGAGLLRALSAARRAGLGRR